MGGSDSEIKVTRQTENDFSLGDSVLFSRDESKFGKGQC
jgi:hypothetical protein